MTLITILSGDCVGVCRRSTEHPYLGLDDITDLSTANRHASILGVYFGIRIMGQRKDTIMGPPKHKTHWGMHLLTGAYIAILYGVAYYGGCAGDFVSNLAH